MSKDSLFAAEEREAKLNPLGDVLRVRNRHVEFAALAARRPGRARLRGPRGQIIDARRIPVPIQRNGQEEQDLVQAKATPAGWSPAQRRQQDPDADTRLRPGFFLLWTLARLHLGCTDRK